MLNIYALKLNIRPYWKHMMMNTMARMPARPHRT